MVKIILAILIATAIISAAPYILLATLLVLK